MHLNLAIVVLLAVLIGMLTKCDACTQGFPSFDEVTSRSEQCPSPSCSPVITETAQRYTFIMPNMTFTCSGTINRWRVGGVLVLDPRNDPNPRLQIWRRQSSSSSTYTIAHEIPLFTCNTVLLSGPSTVHECALLVGVDVQVGDILGMFLQTRIHQNFDRFEVYFDSSFASSTYFRYDELTEYPNDQTGTSTVGTPLVTFEVTPNVIATEGSTEGGSVQVTTDASTPATSQDPTVSSTATMEISTTQEVQPITEAVTTPISPGDPTVSITTMEMATTQEVQPITEAVTTRDPTMSITTMELAKPREPQPITKGVTITEGGAIPNEGSDENLDTITDEISVSSTAPNDTSPILIVTPPAAGLDQEKNNSKTVIIVCVVITLLLVFMTAIFLLYVAIRYHRKKAKKLSKLNDYSIHYDAVDSGEINMKSDTLDYYSLLQDEPVSEETSFNYKLQKQDVMEFEIVKNPEYSLGICVPSEDERKQKAWTMKSQDDEYTYATVNEDHHYYSSPPEFFSEASEYWAPASNSRGLYAQLSSRRYREILRYQIRLTEEIGAGQFGTVKKGSWHCGSSMVECAVKTLHHGASEQDQIKFLQEAAINGQFHHPNVVQLLGVVTLDEPVMIVLEFLSNGDLFSYLHTLRPSPGEAVDSKLPHFILKICREVAEGMKYLSGKSFVHRDLAARNILIGADTTCKISDFGMSRNLDDNTYYITQGGKIPVKWTAPEALDYKKYSTASDVWSYGAVMYETWSLGRKPFDGYTNSQTLRMITQGYRLPPPPGCPQAIYALMIKCWHSDAHQRPSFSAIVKMLSHSDSQLLSWSDKDLSVHPQVSTLGAPTDVTEELYQELQDYYHKLSH